MNIEDLGKYNVIIDFEHLFTKSVTNIYYKEGEVGTSSVKAKLVKKRTPLNLTGCRIIVNIIDAKGSRIVDTANILDAENGIVEILFGQVALNTGISFFELTVMSDEYKTKKSPKIAYRVLDSLSEDAIIESEKFPILVNLIKDVDELNVATNLLSDKTKLLNEEVRALNEQVTQAEAIRETQEGIRQSQEIARQASVAKMQSDINAKIVETNAKIKETTDITTANTKKIDDKIVDIQTQLNTSVSDKFKEVDNTLKTKVDTKFSEVDTTVGNKLSSIQTSVDAKILEADNKIKEADDKIIDVEGRMTTIQTTFDDLVDGKGFAKEEYVDSEIVKVNKELDRVKKLEEATTTTVVTESSFKNIEETTNGYLSDIKLEGKTLFNLWGSKISDFTITAQATFNETNKCIECVTTTNAFSNFFTNNLDRFKPNTDYTFICNIIESTLPSTDAVWVTGIGSYNDSAFADNWKMVSVKQGIQIKKMRTKASFDENKDKLTGIRSYIHNDSGTVGSRVKLQLIVLEGDYTNNPPSYFEGLKSVGDDVDDIVVSSVEGNLINEFEQGSGLGSSANGTLYPSNLTQSNNRVRTKGLIYVENRFNLHYKIGDNYKFAVIEYDSNKKQIKDGGWVLNNFGLYVLMPNCYYVTILIRFSDNKAINVSDVNLQDAYIGNKSDRKNLLYLTKEGVWIKPTLRERDTIEKHSDGKYYYHKRSVVKVLNGSDTETWSLTTNVANPRSFVVSLDGENKGGFGFVCDKYSNIKSMTQNGIWEFDRFATKVAFSDNLSTYASVDLWKNNLKTNPITIVYELPKEEVYECTSIDLISYVKETNYTISSGSILPKTSIKVQNYIGNVINTLKNKVSVLEDYYMLGLKKVLSGDVQGLAYMLYPKDFTQDTTVIEEVTEATK